MIESWSNGFDPFLSSAKVMMGQTAGLWQRDPTNGTKLVAIITFFH